MHQRFTTSKLDNETMHWQKRERDFIMGMCRERGLEVEVLGEKRDNYTIPEYKAARKATDELTAELEILNAEKQEVEAAIAYINSEAENSRGEIEENKQHLEEINAEIAEREKMCKAYEKKIDKIQNAGKPVKKELDVIRKRTKELPALLGGEKSIKISEQDFERVMDMAQASGTLQKLNAAYDIDMERMQIKIEKLTSQVQILTAKLVKAETFLKMKKLLEEFKEYLKPNSIKKSLQGKKRSVEEYDRVHLRNEVKKDKGIAI